LIFMERTFLAVKPDGVKRGMVGEILSRFEKLGLKIVGMKMVWVDEDLLRKHYDKDEAWFEKVGTRSLEFWKENGKDPNEDLGTDDPIKLGKMIHQWLLDFMKSGPVVAMVLEGPGSVEIVKKHVGPTYPIDAPPGTIRGDYTYDSPTLSAFGRRAVYNLVHCSGVPIEAEFEIGLWFKEHELFEYQK